VHVPVFQRDVGLYFTELLNRLGFRASLGRVLRLQAYFPSIQDPRSRAQIGFVGWTPDYLSPSGFIESNFTCSSHTTTNELNASRLCNGPLQRQIDRALVAPAADAPRAWAAADRRLTDLAPAVAMTNRRAVVFVSKRVGNVQHHPQWFTLLDQMWVR
jgi:peptide/nickel transport system substrate-binding protein